MNQEQNNAQVNVEVPNGQTLNNENMQSNMNVSQQLEKPKKSPIIKILAIIGGIVVGIVILFVAIFALVSGSSEKLVCKSSEGNITIMYNEETLTGYTTVGISYDLDGQKKYAEQIGTDAYILEFSDWFKNNTSGTCTVDGK